MSKTLTDKMNWFNQKGIVIYLKLNFGNNGCSAKRRKNFGLTLIHHFQAKFDEL